VDVLRYTKGEASTLHGVEGDLAPIRRGELPDAARELGITSV
jgi:LmbE family N-acetylglucosaminyl deacetylase